MNIEHIDDNESSFCYLWSRVHQKKDCVELFSNNKLGDDYFFNRLNIRYPCNEVVEILNSIRSERTGGVDTYYIHLICNTKNSFNLNIPKFGTLKILGFDVNNHVTDNTNEIEIEEVNKQDLGEWIDIFCKSFDLETKNEVTRIITKHYSKLTLFVARYNLNQRIHPAGCCLLFEKNNNIGLYCLGAIQGFRKRGIASHLIGNAIKISKDYDYSTLVMQTLTEEKYDEFYKKLGFRTIYEKELFTLDLNQVKKQI